MRRLALFVLLFSLNAQAFEWSDLWLTKDQQAMRLLEENPAGAAELFSRPEWRGVGDYRAEDFQNATKEFEKLESAEARYNLGNSRAKSGELEQSIAIYDELLKDKKLSENLRENARFNRDLVKQLLQQQNQQQQSAGEGESSQDDKSSQDEQSKENNQQSSEDQSQAQQNSADQESQGSSQSESGQPDQQDTEQQPDQAQQEQSGEKGKDGVQPDNKQAEPASDEPLTEEQQATEQWLRRIPDDPSGLLRRKLQQAHRSSYPNVQDGGQPW